MKKKKGLTLEEHTDWGKELATMRERLVTLTVQISNAYGAKAVDTANKCVRTIDALRSLLDNHVFTEQPGRATSDNYHIYYPGTDSSCGSQAADIIQHAQTAVGQLRDRYNQRQREFWALAVAWEAARFAWYIVTGNLDTARNKLDLVKTAVTDFERMDAL